MEARGIGILILKLSLASLVGLILGLEREGKHKSLGLKTCVIISITSCLLTIVSIEFAASPYKGVMFTGADPMRLASQIVSGIGFLGAGVIFRRDDDVISGLTTAAIVWTAAGFGIAIAAGYYLAVALSIGLVHMAVSYLPSIMRELGPDSLKNQEIYLKIDVDSDTPLEELVEKIEELVISLENVKIRGDDRGSSIEMRCIIDDDKGSIHSKYDRIKKIKGINYIEITKI